MFRLLIHRGYLSSFQPPTIESHTQKDAGGDNGPDGGQVNEELRHLRFSRRGHIAVGLGHCRGL